MKILLLTLYFAPDVGANAVIMTELAEELAKAGHDLTIITSMPHYSNHVVDKEYRGRLFMRDEHHGIRVIRTIRPNPKARRFYAKYFEQYRRLYPALKDQFARIAALPGA